MDTFEVKAANPDDELEVKEIIKLFHTVYGESFPTKRVYDPLFWAGHIGSRFTSLLVTHQERVIGHLAVQPERYGSRHVQLLFPVYDPAFQEKIDEISNSLWSVIQRMSDRQMWSLLYLQMFGVTLTMQRIAATVFNTEVVTLCPGYFPPLSTCYKADLDRDEPTVLLLAERIFDINESVNSAARSIYVPEEHREICEFLYQPLGLKRNFYPRQWRPVCASNGELPADARAVEKHYFRDIGLCQLFVRPTLAGDYRTVLELTEAQDVRTSVLFVSLQDAQCPVFCERLEEQGYRFCGIAPRLQDQDNIVYYKEHTVGPEHFPVRLPHHLYSKQAKVLSSYIENYNLQDSIRSAALEDAALGSYQDLYNAAGNN